MDNLDTLKDKRVKLRNKIYSVSKRKDSKDKFEKLIDLTNEYNKLTFELTMQGFQVETSSQLLRESYWKHLYDEFVLSHEDTPKKTDKKYNISLCWSVRPDYYVCEGVVSKVREYLLKMGLKKVDECQQQFDDRTEFCETYRFVGAKVLFTTIVKSAEYVLEVSSDSIHDMCNVGVYGKKVE